MNNTLANKNPKVQGTDAREHNQYYSSSYSYDKLYYTSGINQRKHEYITTFYRGAVVEAKIRSKYELKKSEINKVIILLNKKKNEQ